MRFLQINLVIVTPCTISLQSVAEILWALSAERHRAPACSVEQNMTQLFTIRALLFVAMNAVLDIWVRSWGEADRIRSWWPRRAGR